MGQSFPDISPPGGLSSQTPCTGDGLAHSPTLCIFPCPLPHTGKAQSHEDTVLPPSPQRVLWGRWEREPRELAMPLVTPQPPTTAASELTRIPIIQLGGTGKRAHQMEKAESVKTDFLCGRDKAPAPGECSSISKPHLLFSQERPCGHTRGQGSASVAPWWQITACPDWQAWSMPRDRAGEGLAGLQLVSTTHFPCPGLLSGKATAVPSLAMAG